MDRINECVLGKRKRGGEKEGEAGNASKGGKGGRERLWDMKREGNRLEMATEDRLVENKVSLQSYF